jgi:hypothetical protein
VKKGYNCKNTNQIYGRKGDRVTICHEIPIRKINRI